MRCVRRVYAVVLGGVLLAGFAALAPAFAFEARAYRGAAYNRPAMPALTAAQQRQIVLNRKVRAAVRRADIAFANPPYSASEKRALYGPRWPAGRGGWTGPVRAYPGGYGYGATPIVLPSTVDVTPPASSTVTGTRSIADIPATTGIRPAPVAEPVLYRIEGGRARAVTTTGPRVIDMSAAGGDSGATPSGSPYIIQVRPN